MSEDESLGLDMFQEEETPVPDPVFQLFTRMDGGELSIRLVHHSPLWGHLLWSAGKILANYLDSHQELYRDKNVLELGAAGALPSLICAYNGAKTIVATDYPDPDLIQNIDHNLNHSGEPSGLTLDRSKAHACGYIWGRDVQELLSLAHGDKYDLLILSDLVFNHQAHRDLLKTCRNTLADRADAQALVFFTHHRPHLAHKDMAFFDLARDEFDFTVEHIIEDKADANVMFEEGKLLTFQHQIARLTNRSRFERCPRDSPWLPTILRQEFCGGKLKLKDVDSGFLPPVQKCCVMRLCYPEACALVSVPHFCGAGDFFTTSERSPNLNLKETYIVRRHPKHWAFQPYF
ncbi:Protein N-terminal and lysine N-methyltransferase efm7 [Savitreella phatthalungensis]